MPAHLPTYPGAAQSPISPCSRWSGDPETILCLCTCPTPADTPTCLPSYMGRPAYLSTYLPTCRPAYLATRRPTCLSTNLLTCLPTYLPILGWSSPKYPNAPLWSGNKNNNLPMDMPSRLPSYPGLPAYLPTYQLSCLPAYMPTCLPTYLPAYLATRRPTCLSTNLLTCLSAYLPSMGWANPHNIMLPVLWY